jgi:hypothetical protein
MRPVRRALLHVALLTLLFLPARAYSETIQITGGFLTSTGSSNFGTFDLSGVGFRIVGSTDMGFVSPSECFPCMPGDLVALSANLSGGLDLDGPITIDGLPFSNPADANFLFTGPSIAMPSDPRDFTVTRAFTFSGN